MCVLLRVIYLVERALWPIKPPVNCRIDAVFFYYDSRRNQIECVESFIREYTKLHVTIALLYVDD